jgi:hypothetical protein
MNVKMFSDMDKNLIYLIAYIVQSDPNVSDEEINYVSTFIRNNFNRSLSGEILIFSWSL